jgi:hypothetical protein
MIDSMVASHKAELAVLDGYLAECDKLGIMSSVEKVE